MTPAGSNRGLIAAASELIEQWTGFSPRQTAPKRIAEAFRNRAARLGYNDPTSYLEALRRLEPTEDEAQRLINLVTNGLTGFWRDTPQLSALRSLLNHLHDPVMSNSPVYVWCAGVSTGEEAHTVAMIAHEEAVPVQVLGTDINTDFLQTARRGLYSDWSLRRLPPDRRRSYLRRLDDHHWTLDHRCFDRVRFVHHNVLDSPPESSHPDGRWDIVMCRNVLIYFTRQATTRALRQLTAALSRQGHLMFGSSEQIHPDQLGDDAPAMRSVRRGKGFLYRPGRRRTGETIEPGGWPDPEQSRSGTGDSTTGSPPGERDIPSTREIITTDTVAELLDTAADHLLRGEHEQGLACLEAVLGYDPFHIESHCAMGAVLLSLGARTEALEAFRRALFLEPTHWFAAHRAATIHENLGDAPAARKMHRRATEGLDADDDPLADPQILHHVIGSVDRVRRLAKSSAEEFFRLHGDD